MKRKLEQTDDVSSKSKIPKTNTPKQPEPELSFAELRLDARLLQAVAKLNFEKPTLVQRKTIPIALDGKDVLATAHCGSGKTAAYLLPILSGILKRKAVCDDALVAFLLFRGRAGPSLFLPNC